MQKIINGHNSITMDYMPEEKKKRKNLQIRFKHYLNKIHKNAYLIRCYLIYLILS